MLGMGALATLVWLALGASVSVLALLCLLALRDYRRNSLW